MSLGNRIKKLRKEKNLTADELGDLIGKNRATIYRYENKKIENLSINILEPLAKALNTTPAYLMGWNDQENNINTSIVEKISEIAEQLEKQRQNKVLTYAKNEFEEQNKVKENNVMYSVKAVSGAAAGVGYSYDNNDIETYYTNELPPKHDYATVVCGDSMEPLISNGDIVYIKSGYSGSNGDVYVVDYDGKSFIKKLYHDGDRLRLVSINDKYEPIYISLPTDTYLNIVGKVVGSFKPKK